MACHRVCDAQVLIKWWAEYPPALLEARVVQPLQAYLTSELCVTKKLTVSVMNTIKVPRCMSAWFTGQRVWQR